MPIILPQVTSCHACALRETCKAPIPGNGSPKKGGILLVGEAPGEQEDMMGRPFVGKAGMELDRMLQGIGLDRSMVHITNLVKCRPPKNRDPKPAEVLACTDWLTQEVTLLTPWLIVTLGRHSMNWFRAISDLQPETMDHQHGIPFKYSDIWVIPVYHPAAGLHNPRIMQQVEEDFAAVGMLVTGVNPEDLIVKDQHPYPIYTDMTGDSPHSVALVSKYPDELAVDIETVQGSYLSVQGSSDPGTAFVTNLPVGKIEGYTLLAHNWLHDMQFLPTPAPDVQVVDTMVAAYLLGLPQALKTLARRLCGMQMQDYEDLVLPYRRKYAEEYLWKALALVATDGLWMIQMPFEEEEWDNKKGKAVTRSHKPQAMKHKIWARLEKLFSDPLFDPFVSWHYIRQEERAPIEAVLGLMPEAWLTDVPNKERIYYSCRDADATLRVWHVLKPRLEQYGLGFLFYNVEMPIIPILRKMIDRGMVVDVPFLENIQAKHGMKMKFLAEEIAQAAGHGVNPNSGLQVANLLYSELKYPVTKRTRLTNIPVTDDRELKKIDHPVVPLILDYRASAKIKGTYCDPIIPRVLATEDHALHTTLMQTRTGTGRLASKDPNLQNIPQRTEAGREVRDAFMARPGYSLLSLDYSQIEVRVFAHVAQAKHLIKLFQAGRDVHTENAALFFKVALDKVTESQRYGTKRGTFGWLYWISPEGLTETMHEEGAKEWSLSDSENLIGSLDEVVPEMAKYRQETIQFGREKGYVQDMFGRIMWAPALRSDIESIRNAAQREAANMPIQSGAQGIIKLAKAALHVELEKMWGPDGKWLLQIHDELIFEVKTGLIPPFAKWAAGIMSGVVSLGSIPVLVGAKSGLRWGSLNNKIKL